MWESEEDDKEPDFSGLIIAIVLLPIFFVFKHFGKTEEGLNVFLCVGVNAIAIKIRWDLRENWWFWGVMVLVVGVEIPLVLNIQWPHRWVPGVALLPIGIAGCLIAFGAIKLAERLFGKPATDEN